MLEREIEVHRSLSHPNIIKLYDVFKTSNFYYLVTEYCADGDLNVLLTRQKNLEQSKAEAIIRQLINGYLYLIKRKVLHRDLKPANIMKSGSVWKIGDFGFSMFCHS